MVAVARRKHRRMPLKQFIRVTFGFSLCLAAVMAMVAVWSPTGAFAKARKEVHSVFQDMQPMTVRVVRNAQPGCEPDCAEWISAEGDIVPACAIVRSRRTSGGLDTLSARKRPDTCLLRWSDELYTVHSRGFARKSAPIPVSRSRASRWHGATL